MNKLLLYLGICLLSFSLVSASLLIQEPEFNQEFAFDTSPTFSWSGCDEETYLLQIARDGLFESMEFQQVVSQETYSLEFDLDPNNYFARVQAIGGDGGFVCTSPTVDFKVKELSPLAFSFNLAEYEQSNLLKVRVNGPLDAAVAIDISSENGFNLPIELSSLSEPDF